MAPSMKELADEIKTLRRDAEVLALRLLMEDEQTMSPETLEVMDRWRPALAKKYGLTL